ncbi:HNH endonuclease [Xanthomonas perforans]
MRTVLRQRLLLAAQTDAQAQLHDGLWETRCLHCRRHLQVLADGEPLGHTTLEHVVPQAWFGRRAQRRHDANGAGDARAYEVVSALLSARLARWRAPPAPTS